MVLDCILGTSAMAEVAEHGDVMTMISFHITQA